MPKVKPTRPKKNSLWSRKDARRPGVVKVVKIANATRGWYRGPVVWWEDINTGRKGEVALDRWHKSYAPFVAPTPTLQTHNDEPGK